MHREIKKSKILIIDDNTTNLDLMVEILKQEEYDNIQTLIPKKLSKPSIK